jgi:hypothetical protein
MNRFGVVLNQIGLEPFNSLLQGKYIWPISRFLYPKEGENFDDHHCFCVKYAANEGADVG